jgi:rubrerythrin
MKKSSIVMVFVAIASIVVFQSFISYTGSKAELNKNSSLPAAVADAKTITFQNLQDAFKGESNASAKYEAYSKKAEQEGYHEIAMLFKAASASEKIHANNHKAVLGESGQNVPEIKPEFTVKSTKENLKDAITGEGYEVNTMYPEFMTNANTASNQYALVSLNYAYKTEQKHKVFYEKALAALEANTVKSLPAVYFVCPTCGNTYDAAAPKRCGISMTGGEKFIKIDKLVS